VSFDPEQRLPQIGWADATAQRTLVSIEGPDAAAFVHRLCTNDVLRLKPHDATEAFFTTDQGRTLALAIVIRTNTGVLLEAGRTPPETLLSHLTKYHITEELSITDATSSYAHFILVGLVPDELSGLRVKGGYPGVEACEHLFAAVDQHQAIRDELARRATELKIPTIDRLRIVAGWPESGIEVTAEHFPQEFRRDETAISYTKGCYLGQETVSRIHTRGHVNRYFVPLVLEGDPKLPLKLADQHGQEVGVVTALAPPHEPNQRYAVGFVKRGLEHPGTRLIWQTDDAHGAAAVRA